MDDLISRKDAIDAICSVCGNDCDRSKFLYDAPQDEQMIICSEHYVLTQLPSAQKTGRWIEQDDSWDGVYYECSVCGEPWTLIDGTPWDNYMNFCPNCGADMRGDKE